MECLPGTGTVEASDWVGKLKIDESVMRYLVSQVAKFLGRKVPVGFGGGIDCFVAELANVGTLGKFPLPDGFLWLVEIVERAVAIATEGLTAKSISISSHFWQIMAWSSHHVGNLSSMSSRTHLGSPVLWA